MRRFFVCLILVAVFALGVKHNGQIQAKNLKTRIDFHLNEAKSNSLIARAIIYSAGREATLEEARSAEGALKTSSIAWVKCQALASKAGLREDRSEILREMEINKISPADLLQKTPGGKGEGLSTKEVENFCKVYKIKFNPKYAAK